ncbi:toll/interleukin-1 receptor domain-containing protein [Psychrosphaera sp. B3R10]|uniref:toll/interleukin-1 receptor domain-containing protein n=1 Tax=unclassified Psychrosphaera TaxID=2641570 RepID=UPI001C09C6A0|nr:MULTISPECIES: toll/interleukin-1 receptor domain-containing protein [unclassified Psychrosphaera]MBU2882885.1 toll/interleukin-1 receptor domain-containing protein [Psychrosphaera sp. I2R16]MBU2991281.1 toll/interleukin-1 receptor domain-containing protein [Psychrosphaera sp. B3R10]
MIDFTTFDDLKRFNANLTTNKQATLKSRSSSKGNKDTFLSHSSKDEEYLPAVINLLESHGASVYCDLGDNRLPDNPSPETASILKNQIKESRKQVVFVTTNSKDSKWVPWELGIGDSSLSTRNVALLPAAASSYEQSWAQQEYLGLYRHIVWGTMVGEPKPLWLVYDYHTNTAQKLRDWLAR